MWKRMVHGQLGGCENLQQGPRLPAASKAQSFMVGGEEQQAVCTVLRQGGFGSEELMDEKAGKPSKGQIGRGRACKTLQGI